MLLTCPNCRSGLEVPDGTTAMVRCPACKTVFSATQPAASEADDDNDNPQSRAKPPTRKPVVDDDDRPRKKPAKPTPEPEEEEEEEAKPRRRKKREVSKLSPEEREALRGAFARAAWGAKLIWVSLGLFMISMLIIIGFWFQIAFSSPNPGFIVGAGIVGMIGWLLAAIGVGLCLSGPPSPGMHGFGIAAAIAVALHLILLTVLVNKGTDYSTGRSPGVDDDQAAKWGLVPTRLDAVTFYLTYLTYKDQEIIPKGEMGFSIVVGIAEMIRTTLILMLLSCLARSAGDEELSHRCTRAAGFASVGPGAMAAGMLMLAILMTESRAGSGDMAKILLTTIVMGTYAVVNACVFPGFMAAREVADACDEPFQSHLRQP